MLHLKSCSEIVCIEGNLVSWGLPLISPWAGGPWAGGPGAIDQGAGGPVAGGWEAEGPGSKALGRGAGGDFNGHLGALGWWRRLAWPCHPKKWGREKASLSPPVANEIIHCLLHKVLSNCHLGMPGWHLGSWGLTLLAYYLALLPFSIWNFKKQKGNGRDGKTSSQCSLPYIWCLMPGDQVIKWQSDRVMEWWSDRVTEWPSNRVTEWPSDWKVTGLPIVIVPLCLKFVGF